MTDAANRSLPHRTVDLLPEHSDRRRTFATLKFAMNLAAPFGFVIWAVLLDRTNGETAVLVAAVVLILVVLTFGRHRPTEEV